MLSSGKHKWPLSQCTMLWNCDSVTVSGLVKSTCAHSWVFKRSRSPAWENVFVSITLLRVMNFSSHSFHRASVCGLNWKRTFLRELQVSLSLGTGGRLLPCTGCSSSFTSPHCCVPQNSFSTCFREHVETVGGRGKMGQICNRHGP